MADPVAALIARTIPAILHFCGDYYIAAKDRKEDIERLQNEVEDLHKILKLLKDNADRTETTQIKEILSGVIRNCCKDLEGLESEIKPKKRQKLKEQLKIKKLKWPLTAQKVGELVQRLEHHKSAMSLIMNTHINANVEDIKQEQQIVREDQLLSKLPIAIDATFNSALWQHKHRCLPETRVELLQQIKRWSTDSSAAPIYWLNGMAGTGKSTISLTLAEFCTGRLFTTIAAQLANSIPGIKHHICHAIEQEPDIQGRRLRDQWEKLIFEPLQRLIATSKYCGQPKKPFIFVIDALDECGNQDDIELVIQLFSELKSLNNTARIRAQAFLTSRPEIPIKFGFRSIPSAAHEDFVLHKIHPADIHHDIKVFIKHELDHIRNKWNLTRSWPEDKDIDSLASKSAGLFIYAATVCRFVGYSKYSNPQKRLHLVLQDTVQPQSTLPTTALDEIYIQVLEDSFIGNCTLQEKEELLRQFKRIIGTIIVLTEPLTPDSLATILQLEPHDIYDILENLNSVIEVKTGLNKISVLHITFRDFLLDKQRSTRHDVSFWIDEKHIHDYIFKKCLELLRKHLRRDICGLKYPSISIEHVDISNTVNKYLPLEVRYAVCNWIIHFEQSANNASYNGHNMLTEFLKTHFLYWLEALSLLRRLSSGIYFWSKLEKAFNSKFCTRWEKELIYDAGRFLRYASSTIESHPLQLYSSALIFCPTKSHIGNCFKDNIVHSPWIMHIARCYEEWGNLLQRLEGHSDSITSLIVSPDGSVLVSALEDSTIRLWDPLTGSCQSVLEGHLSGVGSLAFSRDSKELASGSKDGTVRIWDMVNGGCRRVLKVDSDLPSFPHSAFLPNARMLVISLLSTVTVWDLLTGDCLSILKIRLRPLRVLEFCPDSNVLALASNSGGTVELWNLSTGSCRRALEPNLNPDPSLIPKLAFSPDGKVLASVSLAEKPVGDACYKIYLWDSSTCSCLRILEGHSKRPMALKFSPDGRLLASAAEDNTVRLWDTLTGNCQSVLKGPRISSMVILAFSEDVNLLASASYDTIWLWDISTGSCRGVLQGHSGLIEALEFLQNGRVLASASRDSTIGLWDLSTGGSESLLESHCHSAPVDILAFSPDGKVIASVSQNNTIELWDPLTCSCQHVLEGHTSKVWILKFSPDGGLLASATGETDYTIRLWDPLTGACRSALEGYTNGIPALAFSPDGKMLASAAGDNTIRLWDPLTGDCTSVLKGHSDIIWVFVFSADSRVFASGSGNSDNTVRVWDPLTGVCQNVLEGHKYTVWALALSPDGVLLASGAGGDDDNPIRLWNLLTGGCQVILRGRPARTWSLAFSPDGRALVGASYETVRIWDPSTGQQRYVFGGSICRSISFSRDGLLLQADTTIIEMKRLPLSQHSSLTNPSLPKSLNDIKVEPEWIAWNDRKILRLPSDFRETAFAYHDGFFVIADRSRRLWFIRLNLEILRREFK